MELSTCFKQDLFEVELNFFLVVGFYRLEWLEAIIVENITGESEVSSNDFWKSENFSLSAKRKPVFLPLAIEHMLFHRI